MAIHLPIVSSYLEQQQDMRAAVRFARHHTRGPQQAEGDTSGIYESQIPLSRPEAGQQYGFAVDLDACTGCKACVVACNKLNGLDAGETWRMVGLLQGGSVEGPVQQTVTTACHHCLDPACANGCPVGAYEKDDVTGIVRHLDDQCIGCQYCTLTCPYEVPQYNARLGIVRKCDMCSDRLADGEAPACVAACPNGAITIRIVEKQAVLDDAQGDAFLPGAPSPGITAPTTTFKTKRAVPRNVLPANFYNLRAGNKHWPLVVMLVLTQLSVGAFAVDALWNWNERSVLAETLGRAHSLVALGLGLLALGASVLHLGRPLYAFRAVLGLRRSWMSREIVVFGAFVKLAVLYAASYLWPELFRLLPLGPAATPGEVQRMLSVVVTFTGLLGVVCSVMIYRATHREWWNGTATSLKFFGTAGTLGSATLLLTTVGTGFIMPGSDVSSAVPMLAGWVCALSILKLAYEGSIFLHLFDKQQGDLKRTAILMKQELSKLTGFRFALGAIGGVLIPGVLYVARPEQIAGVVVGAVFVSFVTLVVGEVFERALFFAAVSAPRMPGAVGQ